MKSLLRMIEKLKESEIKKIVDKRVGEFEMAGAGKNGELFKELCFCLLTANFNAEKSIKIQNEVGNGFLTLPEGKLAGALKRLGHRYPNARAKYVVEARKHKDNLREVLGSFESEMGMREWLVKNVKGLGYKEGSHFLRNIGRKDLAIIDFHIVDVLVKHGLIKKVDSLTKNNYLEIEKVLRGVGGKSNLNLAELDLYLWYTETGKILK
ncbi:N-glycosylase/DNA lyase [Candidatus Woesearchaeota archaeon]|nr:N-glycosylase/DNA lyase [Candidatus Woesearchaeota archaeon]